MMPSADDLIRSLGLIPHPEGGFYRETHRSHEMLPAPTLPHGRYHGDRCVVTMIYFLITPGNFSAMHRVAGDELFLFHAGDSVEMLQLHPGGIHSRHRLGLDLNAGDVPQVVVPGGVWQGLRLPDGGRAGYALMGCVVAPGFEFDDFELARRNELIAAWPGAARQIEQLTRA